MARLTRIVLVIFLLLGIWLGLSWISAQPPFQPGQALFPLQRFTNKVRAMAGHGSLGNQECSSCHLKQEPENHYALLCSACHDTSSWKPVRFDHAIAQATDCQSCHAKTRPDNHFPGQCSTCHSVAVDWRGAFFNHANPSTLDCRACHAAATPANHFTLQCSACHTAGTTWKSASFNHADPANLDCQACHAGDAPAQHYQLQCSTCHTPSGWPRGPFVHDQFDINHGGANGNCATCHPKGPPATDCITCHQKNASGG
jgi:hypothetical protein